MIKRLRKSLISVVAILMTAPAAQAITSGSAEATLNVDNQWGAGYCATVTIDNNGGSAITGWAVGLDLNGSAIDNLWNGSLSGDTVTPAAHNATVGAGESTNFGFCANGGSVADLATFAVDGGSGSSSSASSQSSSSSSSSSNPNPGSPDFPLFHVGNITTNGAVRSDFTQYWDQITPENEGKWGSVEGTRDQYNWGPLDAIYDYARANDIPVKAHVLVWGSQRPGWIDGLSAAEQRAEIEEWISDYCARYPDTAMIDVVNEALPSHAPANYAQNAFGNDWITESFRLARQHCPDAVLIYNDFNFLTWDTDAIIDLIRPAVNSGYVDALGLQAHGLYNPRVWTGPEIEAKLDQIAELGLPMYISEYDIQESNDQLQLQYMQTHFPIFYNHPDVVGITLWGYIVGATWREGTGLMTSNGQQRPAMQWLMNYLNR